MKATVNWRTVSAILVTVGGGWLAFATARGQLLDLAVLVVGIAAMWVRALWPRGRCHQAPMAAPHGA